MDRTIRVLFVLTHPVQYFAPWFRSIERTCPELDLRVLHAIEPTPEQQGVGFQRPFRWDVPLTEGYLTRFVRRAHASDDLTSGRFLGVHVGEIGASLRQEQADVVVITGWQSITLVRALLAARLAGIPVLYRGESNLDAQPAGLRGRLWRARTMTMLAGYQGYLSIGNKARAYLQALGRSDRPIFDSPYCVDNSYFAAQAAPWQTTATRMAARASLGISPGDFVTLFVGKLLDHKRPLDVVDAVRQLGAGARLLVVGSGPLEPELHRAAARSKVALTCAGFLNQSELGRAYAASDCLVLPSERETWGLVVNEAMATGLPCIVSARVGCGPDLVVPGETGWRFPVGELPALAAALRSVRDQIEQGHDFATPVRAQIAGYTFARATEGLLRGCRAAVLAS